PVKARITSEGVAMVEEHDGRVYASNETHSTTFMNVVNGSVGQLAQGTGINQAQNHGVDPQAIQAAISALASTVGSLRDECRAVATRAVATIEAGAAEGLPESNVVARRVSKLQEIAEKAAVAAFSSAVGQLVVAIGPILTGG